MPESEVNDEMIRLEDALEVLDERTSESLFAYTATGNGIKEFVFYISDRDQFLESFNTALSDHPRYPIEINFYQDENWQDLRKLISDFSGGS